MAKLHLKLNSNKAKLSSLMLSAVGLFALGTQSAAAQDAAGSAGHILVSSLADVVSVFLNADGSLDLYLVDGTKAVIPTEYVAQEDGVFYIETIAADDLSAFVATDSSAGLLTVVGAFAGVGAIVALASSDDGPGNAAPVFSSGTAQSYAENATTAAYTAIASDSSGDPITFSISGADAAQFNINAATGAVTFRNSPDFETPTDTSADNVYNIIITASDGQLTSTQNVAITVTNENDNAPLITSAVSASVAENETDIGYAVTATDADGDALTYSISGGADAALFVIDSSTGALSFASGRDFEMPADGNTDNQYEVTVEVSDGTFTDSQAVTVTVTNANDNSPVFTSGVAASAAENATATGYAAAATDADGDAVTYTISGGTDAALFTIDASTGALSFANAPDFDTPADANADNVFNVTVRASDGTNATDQAVAVTVTNVNDNSPIFTSSAVITFDENGTASLFSVVATDADGDTLIYSISGGADAARFTIDGTTGAVSFVNSPDFETPADTGANNTYNIIVRADDGTMQSNQAVAITINNLNDNAPVVTGGSASVAENITVTGFTATATDADGNAVTFSISGGVDAALFSVDATTGALSFIAAPDFDNPGDTGADNVYDVIIQGSDGTLTDTAAVAISVTNLNDEIPVFTSAANVAMDENLTVTGYGAAATDGDGDTLSYSISGGADAALFAINSSTGALSFIAAPDFENPGDAGTNNVYDVVVTASDGVNASTQAVAITVQDVVAEAPIFSSGASGTIAENSTATAYTATAVDPNGNPVTYSISGGADAALFTINANAGDVQFIAGADFESPADAGANNVYDIEISAFDGTDTSTQNVAIAVTDVNDVAPQFTSSGTVTSAENSSSAFYTPTVSDPDGGTLSYSIVGGADAAFFTIDAATGAVSFTNVPDFETRIDANANNEYLVTIEVSDGVFTTQQQVRATVTDVDEAPVFDVPGTPTADENQTAIPYGAPASDDDGDTITYSITGGADSSAFTIDANTGQLSFVNAPDFEVPTDTGADNVYDVTVTASSTTFTTDQNVAVTVNDVNDAPVFTGNAAAAFNENGTAAAYTATASDADGDTLTYSIAGGADAALFTIDAVTGAVSFIAPPDFESAADAGANNIYDIIIGVDDGPILTTQAVAITVNNVNDNAPVVTGGAASVAENITATGFTATATDADGNAVTFSISGGADAALFSVDAATGVLSFIAAPDFENPADAGSDNTYDVVIQGSDGTFTDTAAVAISVTNLNDEVPVFTSTGTATMDENLTVTGYTAAATDGDGDTLSYSISGGADSTLFTINSTTGALSFISSPDFENPGDTGANNVYDVEVTANDGVNSTAQSVAITVQDVAVEGPVFSSPSVGSHAENSATVAYTAAAATPGSAAAMVYTISGGADAALFTINAVTGDVSFIGAPDFENPTDTGTDNGYSIEISAFDGTFTNSQQVEISVSDVNDVAPSFTSSGTVTSAENSSAVFYTPAVSDPDGGTLSYSIVGGADAAFFTIDAATGAVSFTNAPDFETRIDANANNEYLVTIEVSDGVFTTQQQIRATVTDVDEAPVFDVPGAVSVDENLITIPYGAPASDDDGDTITYSITGGVDAATFTIDANTGQLSFVTAPNFEAPTDTGADNVYDVTVTAASTTFTTDQNVAVTVNDVNEAPIIDTGVLALLNIIQEGAFGSTFSISQLFNDPENNALTYSVGGPDAGLFTVTANGSLFPSPLLDFENPTDVGADNTIQITITASDGTNSVTTSIINMDVRNIHDEDVVITSGATGSIFENAQFSPAYIATATDPDGLSTPTFAITGGADSALFTIDSATGYVVFVSPPDFEVPTDANTDNIYEVEITAMDLNSTDSQLVSITVQDVSGIQFISSPTASIGEGRFFDAREPSTYLEAVNDSGDPITYSITGGPDASFVSLMGSSFNLPGSANLVRFNVQRDFENPADANLDNVYEFVLTATDGTNTTSQNYSLGVLDLDDEAPTVTSTATASVSENSTLAYTLTATDVDTDDTTLSYFIQGAGADNALFTIDRDTGELSFITPPDFENPADANTDNVYDVTLLASDGTQGTVHTVTITVTDVVNAKMSPPTDIFTDLADDDGWGVLDAADFYDSREDIDHVWEGGGFQQFNADTVDPSQFTELSEAVPLPYAGTQLITDISGADGTALSGGVGPLIGSIDLPMDMLPIHDTVSPTAFDFLQLYNVA